MKNTTAVGEELFFVNRQQQKKLFFQKRVSGLFSQDDRCGRWLRLLACRFFFGFFL